MGVVLLMHGIWEETSTKELMRAESENVSVNFLCALKFR